MENIKIPQHVAIILDGNGRWAKKRGLPRNMGHVEGCKTLERTVEDAAKLGIKYLTVYGFSTENWKRSQDEVGALMQLFRQYMKRLLKVAAEHEVKVIVIGDRSRFAPDIIEGLNVLENSTKNNKIMTFLIAVNYGSRDEITRSVKQMLKDYKNNQFNLESVDEAFLSGYLDTKGVPDPDLLIRTSGEERLSNFLLWQLAYTEFYFSDLLWPDFSKEELVKAIEKYNRRDRRFGGAK